MQFSCRRRILIAIAFASGCQLIQSCNHSAAPAKPPAFKQVNVWIWSNVKPGVGSYDFAVKDPIVIAEFAGYFPELGRDSHTDFHLASKGSVMTSFVRQDDSVLEITVDLSEGTWRHANPELGDRWWPCKDGFRKFLFDLSNRKDIEPITYYRSNKPRG